VQIKLKGVVFMADNKQNQNQKDRTNDAVGMPADSSNQRGNSNMETQGGNQASQGNKGSMGSSQGHQAGNRNEGSMSGGSDRMDTPGNATRGDSSDREAQGSSDRQGQAGSKNQAQNQSGNQGNMQEKRPATGSGSESVGREDEQDERDNREKRPA
jgi:hypothetical protein